MQKFLNYNKGSGVFLKTAFLILFLFFINACTTTPVSRADRFVSRKENLNCQNIISAAKPWMGAPYLYGGNSIEGVDCSGFVQQIYLQVFNTKLMRTTAGLYGTGTFVRESWMACGDLVFFKNIRGRGVDHVGIYIGNNRFIHASSSRGVVISDLTSDYYLKHFVSARRYVE